MQKIYFLVFTLIITYSCLFSQRQQEAPDRKIKTEYTVLFVGNSLTYTNDLPQLVKENAKLKGIDINIKMIAFPNYAIEDHWNDGQVQKLVSTIKYDFVIIQQGPSSQSDGRKMLIEYGAKYSSICKLNKAKLAYFMVWPSLNYYHTFEGVIKNHQDAASINNAIVLPIGKVWKEYIDSTGNKDCYGPDGFHPSLKGSQIAAEVIVEYLFPE